MQMWLIIIFPCCILFIFILHVSICFMKSVKECPIQEGYGVVHVSFFCVIVDSWQMPGLVPTNLLESFHYFLSKAQRQ